MNKKKLTNSILLSIVALLSTLLTFFLGAPFLRALRKSYGPLIYWFMGAVVCGGLFASGAELLAILMWSQWFSSGLYAELEGRGFRWWSAGWPSVAAGTGILLGGFFSFFEKNGWHNHEQRIDFVKQQLALFQAQGLSLKMDPEVIYFLSPSLFVSLIILSLGFALIFEDRVYNWFALPKKKVAGRANLTEFRVPDVLLWVTMVSFLFSFIDLGLGSGIQMFFQNIVVVNSILYLFQGLAILEVFLNYLKSGFFMRFFVYFFIVGQMFLIFSVLGFVDFWFDFRRRLRFSGSKKRTIKSMDKN